MQTVYFYAKENTVMWIKYLTQSKNCQILEGHRSKGLQILIFRGVLFPTNIFI